MPGGPWARDWPADLGAPGLGRKENLSLSGRQSGARQPDQSKAGSRARSTEQSNHKRWSWEGKRWLGTAWGTQCTYPVRTFVPTSFSPKQPSPSFPVLILAWLFSGCDHLYLSP